MYKFPQHEMQKVEEFLSLIAGGENAYDKATFSFIAVADSEGLRLAQGHVILPTGPQVPPPLAVRTPSICGCSVRLSELGVDCRGLVDALIADGIDTPIGRLVLGSHSASQDSISAHLERFPPNFYTSLAHPLSLSLSFAQHRFTNRQTEFQNDLRAGTAPYDSIGELANELGLRMLRWDACTLDVSAHTVVAVDLGRGICDGAATLALLAAHGIDLEPARLGYRMQTAAGKVIERRSVAAGELTWSSTDLHLIGELRIDVPDGSVIQCFASYKGQWLHQGWVVSPGTSINARRVAHEVFDADFEGVKKYLFDPKQLKQNARQLEFGVANLFYMLGFAVNPLVGQFTTDAADLLANTPSGDIAVIECTTGAIDNDGKLSKLLARTAQLAEKLRRAGHSHIRCLPVVVTTLSLSAITDLSLAAEKGIVVLGVESLEAALNQTMVTQDPDKLFNEHWQSVHPAQDSLFATGGVTTGA